jgi:hypothetical protein
MKTNYKKIIALVLMALCTLNLDAQGEKYKIRRIGPIYDTSIPIYDNTIDRYYVPHIMLEGGSSYSQVFQDPDIKVVEPVDLPKIDNVDYKDLLVGGIKSLLFEYKNYKGTELLYYSIFGQGNYCDDCKKESLLSYMNKTLFPNQELLSQTYNWLKPYYQNAFNSITVEEQKALLQKLDIAEMYINTVQAKQDTLAFTTWLVTNKIEQNYELEKVTGFLNRRIMKKQWTIDDCRFWINRLKLDFLPLLKSDADPISHIQITDTINANLFIAINHLGAYGIYDNKFMPLVEPKFSFFQKAEDNSTVFGYTNLPNSFIGELFEIDKEGKIHKARQRSTLK